MSSCLSFTLKYLILYSSVGLKSSVSLQFTRTWELKVVISLCPFCDVIVLHLPGVFYTQCNPESLNSLLVAELVITLIVDYTVVHC